MQPNSLFTYKHVVMKKESTSPITAQTFLGELKKHSSEAEAEKNKRFFRNEHVKTNKVLGIRMATVFSLAKSFVDMPLKEIEKLLDNNYYEARLGAVSIMDFRARQKKLPEQERKQLFDLYIKKHDRINNWDLVDRSAPWVIGGYLFDKPRTILYKLARSKNVWERRTAIVSTYYFIRQDDIEETFKIAALLVHDTHDLIHTAVGGWIREAGKRDQKRLLDFLDKHAANMPRLMLRFAVEKLDKKTKEKYL
jgi:3-methyladenine DNA glycosylase AlkD